MALSIQMLSVWLLALLSVCRTDESQSPAAAWRLSALPLSRAAQHGDRSARQLSKAGADGFHGGPAHLPVGGRSDRRGKSADHTAVERGRSLLDVSVRLGGQSGSSGRRLAGPSGSRRRRLAGQSGSRARRLAVSLKPDSFGAVRRGRAARLAAGHRSSPSSWPSAAASLRSDPVPVPLLRSRLGRGGPRRPPPGSFVVRLPSWGVRGQPYLVRLPTGLGAGPQPRKRKRVVLIVPQKGSGGGPARGAILGGSVGRRPAALQVPSDAAGPHIPAVVPVIRDAEGRYRPAGRPPLQRHQVLNPQTVYTLDNPRLRKSDVKGFGPPKLKDVISCTELDVSDCYV